MTVCGFMHFPDSFDPEPGDKVWACKNEATHTCCDYGGFVCEDHKCRCSKPLPRPPCRTLYERLLEDIS